MTRKAVTYRAGSSHTGRPGRWLAVCVVVAGLLAGCTAHPPPPVQQSATPTPPTDLPQGQIISVATDSIGVGLNPHLQADQSVVTTAVAAMTLPSAFTPVSTPSGTQWRIDPAVLVGAEVTAQLPFTVTYRISPDAQWSDGLPVTADDFAYLAEQMSRRPGVVGPAGYRLIDAVESRAGGKEAVVRFTRPYPAWRELFSAMLPSHVLRGVPEGFATGMNTGVPVSAGRFAITVIDASRDEVRLQRNDRYWRTPAVVDQVVLRRVGTASQLAESMRSGDSRVATLAGGPALSGTLAAIPGVRVDRDPVGRALEVTANTRSPAMADPAVRQALLGSIDPQLVTGASAGDSTVLPVENPVLLPTDPGYAAASPPRPTREAALALLAGAGYRPGQPAPTTSGPSTSLTPRSGAPETTSTSARSSGALAPGVPPLQRDGGTLTVRVGVVAGDTRTRAAADSISDQLQAVGVATSVTALTSDELYGPALTDPRVDLVVGWRAATVSPATRLASAVACDPTPSSAPSTVSNAPTPAVPTTTVPTTTVPTTTVPISGSTSPPSSAADGQNGTDSSGAQRFPSNVSGLCDPTLTSIADRAVTAVDPSADLATASQLLAAEHVRLPVYQDSMITAVGPGAVNVPLRGPVGTAVFGDAGLWNVARR